VVRRPTANGAGHGYAITGHHELTIPVLAADLFVAITNRRDPGQLPLLP